HRAVSGCRGRQAVPLQELRTVGVQRRRKTRPEPGLAVQLNPPMQALPLVLLAAASAAALFFMVRNLRTARTIEDTPTSKIRSAAQGYVELSGTASSTGETIAAPLSGTPCLWYRYTIERYERSGKQT